MGMILLVKGQINQITLTLSEKCDLTVPVFLFWFWNEITKQQLTMILPDVSVYTERYNRFSLTEGTTDNTTFEEGRWAYEVYEQSSASNLDKTDPGCHLVEQGVMKVVDEATPAPDKVYESENLIARVYNG